MRYLNKYSGILFVLLLSFFSIQPFLASGFFPVHDDTQVARVYEMKTALADGMFPVRWVPDLGYNFGYPIFNFYGPFAYYVGGFFNLIGFDSLIATKIMIVLGTLLAGVGMYLLAKEFWGRSGAIVSALLYMYAPYHALNIYVRGAIGELWAYGLIPLIFYSIYKVFKNIDSKSNHSKQLKSKSKSLSKPKETKTNLRSIWFWTSIAAISYAALISSHNLSAMMVTPFVFIFALFLYISSRVRLRTQSYFILLSLLIGILLSGFYWLPVLLEMKFTNVLSVVGGGSDYKDHFICIRQLWDSPWGFAGSAPGCLDGMSFRIGKIHIVMALLSFLPLLLLRSQKTTVLAIILSSTAGLVSLFLTLDFSKFIWDAIPHMAFFQFPWRFLVFVSFFLSFSGGAVFLLINKYADQWFPNSKRILQVFVKIVLISGIIFAIIFHNAKLFAPDKMNQKTAEDYTRKSVLTWDISAISDEYMPPGFQRPMRSIDVPKSKIIDTKQIKILSSTEKTNYILAEVEAKEKSDLPIYLAYFPGWHVYIDNNQVDFKYYKKGLLVTVPKGKHIIEIKFTQTIAEIVGNSLTLTGVFVLLAGIISSRRSNKRE